MFKTNISQVLTSVNDNLSERIKQFICSFDVPFAELSKQARAIAKTFTVSAPSRWEYVVDDVTGLKILKSEKDAEALDHVRQMSDELFK
jgi:hypothetical protein